MYIEASVFHTPGPPPSMVWSPPRPRTHTHTNLALVLLLSLLLVLVVLEFVLVALIIELITSTTKSGRTSTAHHGYHAALEGISIGRQRDHRILFGVCRPVQTFFSFRWGEVAKKHPTLSDEVPWNGSFPGSAPMGRLQWKIFRDSMDFQDFQFSPGLAGISRNLQLGGYRPWWLYWYWRTGQVVPEFSMADFLVKRPKRFNQYGSRCHPPIGSTNYINLHGRRVVFALVHLS